MKRTGLDTPWVLLPTGFVHEAPLQPAGETSTAASTQARIFNALDDPGVSLQNDVFRAVPITSGLKFLA